MCFSLAWFEQVLIWLVIVGAAVALLQLLVSFLLPHLGLAAEVASFIVSAVRIIIWAIVCIFIIVFVFDLIACLLGGGGIGLPRVR